MDSWILEAMIGFLSNLWIFSEIWEHVSEFAAAGRINSNRVLFGFFNRVDFPFNQDGDYEHVNTPSEASGLIDPPLPFTTVDCSTN